MPVGVDGVIRVHLFGPLHVSHARPVILVEPGRLLERLFVEIENEALVLDVELEQLFTPGALSAAYLTWPSGHAGGRRLDPASEVV